MRTIVLVMSFSIISFEIMAQNVAGNINRNEIGLTLFSLKYDFGQIYSFGYYPSLFKGIDYKRSFGKNVLRLGVDYRDRNDKGTGDFTGTSSYKEGRVGIGYQRLLLNKAVRPYLAIDLTYIHSKFQNEFSGGFVMSYLKEVMRYNGIGFAPAFGVKIQLYKSLSLSVETDLEFLWIKKEGTQTVNSPENIDLRITNSVHAVDFAMRLNPLNSASLNFTF